LQDVEGKQQRRLVRLQPPAGGKPDLEKQVQPGRQGDEAEAPDDRKRKGQPIGHEQHGRRLAGDREPAQPHQGVETHLAMRETAGGTGRE